MEDLGGEGRGGTGGADVEGGLGEGGGHGVSVGSAVRGSKDGRWDGVGTVLSPGR